MSDDSDSLQREDSSPWVSRRSLLREAAAATSVTATGLAGCNRFLGSETETDRRPDDESEGPETGTSAPDATATDTATGTSTPQTETVEPTSTSTPSDAGYECVLEADRTTDCSEPKTIESDIKQDRTLGTECDHYRVTADITVSDGATLTIEPGTKLSFTEGRSSIWVDSESELQAVGECDEPIVFTGTAEQRGHWGNITIGHKSAAQLEYVLVEYGGGIKKGSGRYSGGGIYVTGTPRRLSIANSVIRECKGYGVNLERDPNVERFEGNKLTKNAAGAAFAYASQGKVFSDTSTYQGNDQDFVHIGPSRLQAGEGGTWSAIDVPYRVEQQINLFGALGIAPGVTIEFQEDAWLRVQENEGGALLANGTEAEPITFTGAKQQRGHWQGIEFKQAPAEDLSEFSTLAHCIVEYGGSKPVEDMPVATNVAVTNEARVKITNSVIRESGEYGLGFEENVTVRPFKENEVTANADGVAYTTMSQAHVFSESGTYTGNDVDAVHLNGGSHGGDEEVIWDAIDVPYRFEKGTGMTVSGPLTVAPGATIEFEENAKVDVHEQANAWLTAEGTEEDKITFTGTKDERGHWQGIQFTGGPPDESSRNNKLVHCVVEHAGSEAFTFANAVANVAVANGARLTVTHTTLRLGAGFGIQLDPNADIPKFENNTLTKNAKGAAFTETSRGHVFSNTGTYTGNGQNLVYIDGGELSVEDDEKRTWDALDVPYRIKSGTGMALASPLEIEKGTTIEMEADSKVVVKEDAGGSLTAEGRPDDKIVFTGTKDANGHWQGMNFDGGPTGTASENNKLIHCVIEHGGGEAFTFAPAPANVAVLRGAQLSVSGSALNYSGGWGLVFEKSTDTNYGGNTYKKNTTGNVRKPK